MKMQITKTIGKNKYPFTFEGQTLFECVMQSQKLSFFDVHKCGDCGGDNLRLYAYTTDKGGFDYTKITCGDCKAYATFGVPKADKEAVFIRKEDGKIIWDKFESKESKSKDDDDSPF